MPDLTPWFLMFGAIMAPKGEWPSLVQPEAESGHPNTLAVDFQVVCATQRAKGPYLKKSRKGALIGARWNMNTYLGPL